MNKIAKTQKQLEAEGWEIASISGGTHLKRILDMYRELDIEVRLEKVKPEECGDCTQCFQKNNEAIYRIYTRPHLT